MSPTQRTYVGLCLTILTIAGSIAGFVFHRSAVVPLEQMTLVAREAYWTAQIHREGASAAYQNFKRAVESETPALQHKNAHTFGAALFDAEGIAGFAACGSEFNFGCYHEFLGRAIASLGLSVVDQLNQVCIDSMKNNPLACQHGIGHGIQAYVGYTDEALRKALATCSGLPRNDPIGGCSGGVFMEYNLETMLGDEGRIRAPRTGNMLYPCDAVSQSDRRSCAFWAPQWWHQLQVQQHGVGYFDASAIGKLCDAFVSSVNVRACYEGLGTEVSAAVKEDPRAAANACAQSSANASNQLYCTSYAANAIGQTIGNHAIGEQVCAGLSGDRKTFCESYADNTANLLVELPALTAEKTTL